MLIVRSLTGLNYIDKSTEDKNNMFATFIEQTYGELHYNPKDEYIYGHTGKELHILYSKGKELKTRKIKLDFP